MDPEQFWWGTEVLVQEFYLSTCASLAWNELWALGKIREGWHQEYSASLKGDQTSSHTFLWWCFWCGLRTRVGCSDSGEGEAGRIRDLHPKLSAPLFCHAGSSVSQQGSPVLLHPPEDAAAGVPAPIAMRGNLLLLLRAGEAFREFSCAEHSSAALAHSPPGEHLTPQGSDALCCETPTHNLPVSWESLRDFCFAKLFACFCWPLSGVKDQVGQGSGQPDLAGAVPAHGRGVEAVLFEVSPDTNHPKLLGSRIGCYSWPSEVSPASFSQPFVLVESVAVSICSYHVSVHGDKWPLLGQDFRSPQYLVWVVLIKSSKIRTGN